MKNIGNKETHWEKQALRMGEIDIDKYYNTYPGLSRLRAFDKLLPSNLEGKKILDVGCGIGKYFRYFKDKGARELVGVDTGETLLKIGKEVNPFVNTVLARGEDLPFPNENFDVVLSMGLLEHFKDPYLILKEWVRVLKCGGLLIVETPNMLNLIFTIYKILNRKKLVWEHWWAPNDLIREIKKNPSLKFDKLTSAQVFPWLLQRFVDNKITRIFKLPVFIAEIERTGFLEYFGSIMFVSAMKTDS